MWAAVLAAPLFISVAFADPGAATAPSPDVATLLFETPQWDKAPDGTTLTYSYAKKTEPAYGPSFDDKIVLTLAKGDNAQARNVEVKMFGGEHHVAAGPFASVRQNPVLLLVLEANVEDLWHTWGANPRYLKNAIRKAWRDDAKIEKAQIEVDGKRVPGTRITTQPFKDDAKKDRMMGLESMVYSVEIADSTPGQIAAVDIHAPVSGPAKFSELLRFQSEKGP